MIKRAYTLLEVVLAIVLGAALITAGLKWSTSIAQVAIQSIGVSDSGNIPIAFSKISDDVTSSSHCAANNFDPIVRELTPYSITFLTRQSEQLRVAYYRVNITTRTLERGWGVVDENCSIQPPASYQTLVTDLDVTRSYFAPVVMGQTSTDPGEYLSCINITTPGCARPSFTLHFKRSNYSEFFEESFIFPIK